ncbi:MYND-type domain-containing protein [Mycena kentingensis (nom. inval.)]|nr:MYND-type domain-containing protein [Mycena kentingensis (nom. inval.)]
MESLGSALNPLQLQPHDDGQRSETCAATKLLQCRELGLSVNVVSGKFDRPPENSPDLSTEEFLARKAVIAQVEQLMVGPGAEHLSWQPILSKYEIVKSSAKKSRDWGHLLFTTATSNQFLLVMIFPDECNCGNFSHHDYAALTKFHANKFLCLAKYIWHANQPPKWIRATYLTPSTGYSIDPVFAPLQTDSAANEPTALASFNAHPSGRYLHLDVKDITPALTPSEAERIDTLVARTERTKKPMPAALRAQLVVREDEKGRAKPDVGGAPWREGVKRACAFCEVVPHGKVKLQTCSRCKLVQYCGKECQTMAWPSHKHFCKKV